MILTGDCHNIINNYFPSCYPFPSRQERVLADPNRSGSSRRIWTRGRRREFQIDRGRKVQNFRPV